MTLLQILHHVQGMSELLVQLHSIGYTKYIGFVVKFRCATVELSKLESVYEEMKHDFTFWSSKCDKIRNKCSQLNYFTSEQLLYLQKELAAVSLDSDTCQCSVKLLTLLQSVNPKVDSKVVLQSLRNAKETVQIHDHELHHQRLSIIHKKSLLSEQRLQNLTPYQIELCKELKKDSGFKMRLLIRGLGEISAETTDSPISILRKWCKHVDKNDSGDDPSPNVQLTTFQKKLVNELEQEQISKATIINGLLAKKIKEDPKDILRFWCTENEYEHDGNEECDTDEDLDSDSADLATPSHAPNVDANHPLVIQLLEDDTGYTLETAIKSVLACGENATFESVQEAAYLISEGMEADAQPLPTKETW